MRHDEFIDVKQRALYCHILRAWSSFTRRANVGVLNGFALDSTPGMDIHA